MECIKGSEGRRKREFMTSGVGVNNVNSTNNNNNKINNNNNIE
jgi:hypothetical protein